MCDNLSAWLKSNVQNVIVRLFMLTKKAGLFAGVVDGKVKLKIHLTKPTQPKGGVNHE